MIRILIGDDHAIVRQGLRQVLTLEPELELVAEARNGWEVIELVRTCSPNLLLLDMNMPGPSGVDLIKRVREEAPRLPILVLSMHGESQIAGRAIKAGAAGYLTKDSEPETLIAAIHAVAGGAHYVEPAVATRLLFDVTSTETRAPHLALSDREYQIFLMLVQGRSVTEIAATLHLSAKTVSTHKFRLMQKLGLDTLSDLVRYALKHELA
ncbi:response regulator transcription factor [Thiobacillus sp.]|uniref:response regulator n=1 Tax=Thiobacillus sp. TaxID=924 RepID=UPI0017CED380|nr:response regulator transcription factor [Thiobacillus sp.]MBC2731918.1 response regulator transcription factor [Thiobacillus sp.]MBC2740656.1 response regulator transcription factor [Thiobacillus sp.]MBC2758491.1 response regulator transcription factor [Thiobacillus sp.]